MQVLGESKNESDHQLGDHGSVYFACVGQHYVALDQLGKHQLIYASRGRVNPAKAARKPELLRLQRPRHRRFGIA